jgi:hypothetical protein
VDEKREAMKHTIPRTLTAVNEFIHQGKENPILPERRRRVMSRLGGPVRLLRFVGLLSLMIWVGGFTFYSAAVIPILHKATPSLEAGRITQRVTDRLNLVGGATVLVWLILIDVERRIGPTRVRKVRALLLFTTVVLLASLARLHALMDERIADNQMGGFYPWHRAYLIVSTVQWFVNLGLLGLSLRIWEERA